MKYPLVPVVLLYGAGVVLGYMVEAPLLGTWFATAGLTLAALLLQDLRTCLLPVPVLLFGWWNMTVQTAVVSPHDLRSLFADSSKLVEVRGAIVDTPSQRVFIQNGKEKSHTIAGLELTAVRIGREGWRPAHGRIMTRTAGVLPHAFFAGQRVAVSGLALRPPPPIASELFDYSHHLATRGMHYELKVESPADWQPQGLALALPMAERFRAWAQDTLARGLPAEDESLRLQWAMLLGWQTALTSEVSEPFMRSGTMHIFAISGLHIALIAGIFVALLRAAALPRMACGLMTVPIIWFYTAATGWQASAIRSTVMMSVIICGWALKRPPNLLNSLAAAAGVILVWQPEQLFQAGFQLSFFVVLSIALLSPPIEKLRVKLFALDPLLPYELRPRWQRAAIRGSHQVWKGFATSLAAFLGSAPLMACYFHLFTPGSLLANLVVVPVSSLALMCGLGAIMSGDVAPVLTELFNHGGWFWMSSMIWLSERAAALPAAWCHVRAPGPLLFFLYYGLLLGLCSGWFAWRRLRWVAGPAVVLLAVAWGMERREQRGWHRLTVLPINGSHVVHVEPARGAGDWLVNCGNRSGAGFILKPFLQARGVNHLAHLMLTHGDAGYFGGVAELQGPFRIQEILASPVAFRSTAYHTALAEMYSHSRVRRDATNGMEFPPWKILHPSATDRYPRAADNAIVALGNFEGVRVLLVSQLSKAGLNALSKRHPNLRADLVIAGWPEQDEPLATEWLTALQPRLIVAAAAEGLPTRRDGSKTLNRWRRAGIPVISTGEAGATTISIRDGRWRAETAHRITGFEPEPERAGRDAPGG